MCAEKCSLEQQGLFTWDNIVPRGFLRTAVYVDDSEKLKLISCYATSDRDHARPMGYTTNNLTKKSLNSLNIFEYFQKVSDHIEKVFNYCVWRKT